MSSLLQSTGSSPYVLVHIVGPLAATDSLSFWFVDALRKKSFHISIKSHNAVVKLTAQSLSVLEVFSGIASCKIFRPSFMLNHFTLNCISLMLFLHELKQVLVLVKQFSFINKNVVSSRCYSRGSTFSHSVGCKRRNLVKAFKFSK